MSISQAWYSVTLNAKPVAAADAAARQEGRRAGVAAASAGRRASYAFPLLDAVSNQFAPTCAIWCASRSARRSVQIERAPAETTARAGTRRRPAIFCNYHAPPLKGPVLITGGRALVLQLVDIFYGGKGQPAGEREDLTDAEERFAARLGRDMGLQLAAAWRDKRPIDPELDFVTTESAKLAAVRADDELLVSASRCAARPSMARP